MPLRVLAGELAVVERDGRPEAFVTVTGRAVLAPASGNFKDGCAVLERPLGTVAPEFATREGLLTAIFLMILPFFILWGLTKLLPPWAPVESGARGGHDGGFTPGVSVTGS